MDSKKLKVAAELFEQEATRLAASGHAEVAALLQSLRPLLVRAKGGNLSRPIEWALIPGAWQFSEGSLRAFSALEAAYASLKIELSGGESPALAQLREQTSTRARDAGDA